jgi:hypothetical protein
VGGNLLDGTSWLQPGLRQHLLARAVDDARRARQDRRSALQWMVIGIGDSDVRPHSHPDQMCDLLGIAAGWVWGYHRP